MVPRYQPRTFWAASLCFFPLLQVWSSSSQRLDLVSSFALWDVPSSVWSCSRLWLVHCNMKGKTTTNLQSFRWRISGWLQPLNRGGNWPASVAWDTGLSGLSSVPQCPKQASHQFIFHQVCAPPAVWAGKLLTLSPCPNTPGVPQEAGRTHRQCGRPCSIIIFSNLEGCSLHCLEMTLHWLTGRSHPVHLNPESASCAFSQFDVSVNAGSLGWS